MSDKLFLGSYFFEDCPVSATLLCVVLGASVITSMFQVSSVVLLDAGLLLEEREWWRAITGLFVVPHPDELILIAFILYCSRSYEAARGSWAYLALFLEALVLSSLPAIALGLWSYFRGYYLTHFACTYAGALATASIVLNWNTWRATVIGSCTISGNFGLGIVYLLLCFSRFSLEALIFTAWSGILGALVGLAIPPLYISGCTAPCRRRRSRASRSRLEGSPDREEGLGSSGRSRRSGHAGREAEPVASGELPRG